MLATPYESRLSDNVPRTNAPPQAPTSGYPIIGRATSQINLAVCLDVAVAGMNFDIAPSIWMSPNVRLAFPQLNPSQLSILYRAASTGEELCHQTHSGAFGIDIDVVRSFYAWWIARQPSRKRRAHSEYDEQKMAKRRHTSFTARLSGTAESRPVLTMSSVTVHNQMQTSEVAHNQQWPREPLYAAVLSPPPLLVSDSHYTRLYSLAGMRTNIGHRLRFSASASLAPTST